MGMENVFDRRISVALHSFLMALVISFSGCGGDGGAEVEESADVQVVSSDVNYEWNLDETGYAIHGYDPVSYKKEGDAKLGVAEFESEWAGAKWRFENQENLDSFTAAPEKYVPANGGYCTFGVVLNKKFDGDPTVWAVHQESVHLFLNEDVKEKFLQDTDGNFTKVVSNWPGIKGKAPAELE
ncbi:MAG: YHS domain-containing protein [Verrucomicrobia bacterium]|nr:YHS domain-containing protein [Verrucomicrobiota bacterium]